MTLAEDILEHYGVKGMKWGVRKEDPSGSGPVVAPTKGGAHSSSDVARLNQIHRQAQAQGTGTVSNKDLQDVINRMNMEQNYSRLNTQLGTTSKGAAAVGKILKKIGPALTVTGLTVMAERSGNPQAVIAAKVIGLALGAKSLHDAGKKSKNK